MEGTPLSVSNPELAAQASGWDPTTLSAGSHRRVEWRCERGHVWSANVKDRARGAGCPYCSGNRVLVGFNDLATSNPELAAQASGWDPTTLSAGSHRRVEWRCERGHVWSANVKDRARGAGCPYCSGNRVLVGFNDLATSNPELAAQASGWDPTTLSAGSHRRVEWRCERGHVWSANVKDRARGAGCPYCSGNRVLVGFNDLATSNPELAAQASGWDPTTLSAGSHRRVEWRCERGHIWSQRVDRRTSGGGCPSCSAQPGERPRRHVVERSPTAGADVKAGTRANVTNTVAPTATDVAVKTDKHSPRWLYLLENRTDETLRVGTCTRPEKEFCEQMDRDWEARKFRGSMPAKSAIKLERRISEMLQRRGVQTDNESGPDESHVTWSIEAFPVKSLKKLVKLADEMS